LGHGPKSVNLDRLGLLHWPTYLAPISDWIRKRTVSSPNMRHFERLSEDKFSYVFSE
jgi:hypothetical protein